VRAWLGAGLALLIAVTAQAQVETPQLSHQFTPLEPPLPAPAFSLEDMDGQTHDLADYRGKVVLVNFWATWCPPCRREMPALEQLYLKLRERGFVVLAINQWEDPDLVFAYLGQLDVFPTFPLLFDPDSRIAMDYRVKGLPTSFLIDRQGRLVYRAIGGREFDHPEIERVVTSLLE
jgi:thiol-disulfide isomerase/thioredoxin